MSPPNGGNNLLTNIIYIYIDPSEKRGNMQQCVLELRNTKLIFTTLQIVSFSLKPQQIGCILYLKIFVTFKNSLNLKL